MLIWLRKFFTRRPKVWAVGVLVCDGLSYRSRIVKAITYGRPDYDSRLGPSSVVGPFRSEVDCEEFIAAVHAPQANHVPEDGEQSHA